MDIEKAIKRFDNVIYLAHKGIKALESGDNLTAFDAGEDIKYDIEKIMKALLTAPIKSV